ncbi:MAG: type II CAAX endopeptidase family protein [Bacteroidaceae bacterium]
MKKSILTILLFFFILQIPSVLWIGYSVFESLLAGKPINLGISISPINLTIQISLGYALVIIYLWKYKELGNKKRYHIPNQRYMIAAVIAALGLIIINEYIGQFLPDLPEKQKIIMRSIIQNPLGIIIVSLIGPIIEELIFRGSIFDALRQERGKWVTIFISALLFGLFHLNFAQGIFAFFTGILLGWITWMTSSIIPAMAIHILNNSTAMIFQQVNSAEKTTADYLGQSAAIAIFIIGIALLVGSIYAIRKEHKLYSIAN